MTNSDKPSYTTEEVKGIMLQLNQSAIHVNPSLPKITGSLASGILLQYLINSAQAWPCKTDQEIMAATGFDNDELSLARQKLMQQGLITTELVEHSKVCYEIKFNNIASAINRMSL